MATYEQIQNYVEKTTGFRPKSCWIAHVKEMAGITTRSVWNRRDPARLHPCPPDKVQPIREALKHFGLIKNEEF